MDYKIEDLTKEEAAYIGEQINEIVPHERVTQIAADRLRQNREGSGWIRCLLFLRLHPIQGVSV